MARATLKSKATLDSREFQTKLAGMNQKVSAFSSGTLRNLGGAMAAAFATGAIVNFGRKALESADRMADLVAILGISAEAMQTLEASALRYGGTAEQVHKGIQLLRRAQGEAIQGNMEYAESFHRLGVTQAELGKLGTEQLLDKVARGFVNAGGGASALADLQAILGRSGIELAGVLRDIGENGLASLIEKAEEAGEVLSSEMIAELAEMSNQLEIAGKRIEVFVTQKLGKMISGLREIGKFWGSVFGVGWEETMRQIETGEYAQGEQTDRRAPHAADPGKRAETVRKTVEKAESLSERAATRIENITVAQPKAADSLASIGGFIGGQTSPVLGAMERAAKAAEISADADKAIRDLAEKNGITLDEIRAALEE